MKKILKKNGFYFSKNGRIITRVYPEPGISGYGYLYNWYAASDANFAPDGWKVPSKTEWETLITEVGTNPCHAMREVGTEHWEAPNTGATNSSEITAFGAGRRSNLGGYEYLLTDACFITTTLTPGGNVYYKILNVFSASIPDYNLNKEYGFSVRLLYNGAGTPSSTVTDIDGNIYDVELIGTQYWTVQNFKCTKLNNGISIPNVTDNTEWANLGSGTGIDYLYGLLYNWYTIDGNSSNLIDGLHVPSDTEWTTLQTYLGGQSVAGGKLKETGTEHWLTPNTGAVYDTYGFTALGASIRQSSGTYITLKFRTNYHCSNLYKTVIYYNNASMYIGSGTAKEGTSIRCMRDLTTQEQSTYSDGDIIESVTDYDGNSYGLIKIGTQGWMNANLRTTKYTNGNSIPTGYTNAEWAALTTAGYCIYDDNTLDNPNGLCAYDNDESNV